MPVLTEIDERIEERPAEAVTATPPPPRHAGQATPLLAMVAGLVIMVLAALVVTQAGGGGRDAAEPAQPAVDPSAITLSARDVSVVTQVYQPGEDSGWHAHSGIHAVAVMSGEVTVYDEQCQPRTVGPGQSYVGGQEPHLVANRTDAPVTMAVTYLNPSAPTKSTVPMAAPAGCGVAPAPPADSTS